MEGVSRDEQHVADVDGPRPLAVDVIDQRAVEDVDDFLARVLVTWGGRTRLEVDAGLDCLAARDAEVVALQVGAADRLGFALGGRSGRTEKRCETDAGPDDDGGADVHRLSPQGSRSSISLV